MNLRVGQADGTSLILRGVVVLAVRLHTHTFAHPFVVCVKLQQDILLGFDFAKHFSIGLDWDTQGIPYLRHKGNYLTQSIQYRSLTGNYSHRTGINHITGKRPLSPEQTSSDEVRLITVSKVTIPPHHIAVFNTRLATDVYIHPGTICSTRPNDLLSIEYPEVLILDTLHNFDPQNMTNNVIIFAYNCGEIDLAIQKNTTVAFMKESKLHMVDLSKALSTPLIKQNCANMIQSYTLKDLCPNYDDSHAKINMDTKGNDIELANVTPTNLSEKQIWQIAEQSAFVHPSTFHPKPRLSLEDAIITPQTKQRLDKLLINFDGIMSHSSTNIGLVTLEEVPIETPPDTLPIASKPYTLALKHQFVKEELQKLLQAGLIERLMSPYASPILVVNKKSQDPSAELLDTRRLVIDYRALNRLAPTIQTTQAKSKGALALVHTPNIDQIWAKLKNAKYFSTLDISSGFHHMPIKKEERHKTAFVVDSYGKFQWCRTPFGLEQAPARFNSLMLKIFFPYMDNFMIFYVDDLLIYSITEQEHLEHLGLVFEMF